MIPEKEFIQNLQLIDRFRTVSGSIVECGVWRGGMSAGIADVLGNERTYYLFDSFEGLPEAKSIDGKAAMDWQKNVHSQTFFNNCRAEIEWAQKAMKLSAGKDHIITKGWFVDSLENFAPKNEIAVLRLDGDWYDSTMVCLVKLFPKVASGGIVVIDDYYLWDGCSKAVHDYLSKNNITARIKQFEGGNLHYIVKE